MRLLFLIGCLALLAATGAEAADTPPDTGKSLAKPAEPAPVVQTMPPRATVAILGKPVVDQADKQIGRLIDVLVDASGEPQAGVLDFGGFMGVGNRVIAVHWAALHFDPEGTHPIKLELTPDEIKSVPEYRGTSKPAHVVTPARVTAPLAETPPRPEVVPGADTQVPPAVAPDARAPAPSIAPPATSPLAPTAAPLGANPPRN